MKKSKLSTCALVLTLALAVLLSCSESDDQSIMNAASDQPQMVGKQASRKNNAGARTENSIYDGSAGDPINLETAKAWAANYQKKNPGSIKGHYFGFEILQQILAEANCSGIRMYYALNDEGVKQLILVGVDFEGNELLPIEGNSLGESGNIVADASFPCPSYCPDKEF